MKLIFVLKFIVILLTTLLDTYMLSNTQIGSNMANSNSKIDWTFDDYELQSLFYGIISELECRDQNISCKSSIEKVRQAFPRDMLDFQDWMQKFSSNIEGVTFYFLLAHSMPQVDKDKGLSSTHLFYTVYWAMRAKYEFRNWQVPDDLFAEYVLPYAVLDEPRVGWRAYFFYTCG